MVRGGGIRWRRRDSQGIEAEFTAVPAAAVGLGALFFVLPVPASDVGALRVACKSDPVAAVAAVRLIPGVSALTLLSVITAFIIATTAFRFIIFAAAHGAKARIVSLVSHNTTNV